jgi:hypothetical protein
MAKTEEHPDNFGSEEFTTEEVRASQRTLADEKTRSSKNARKTGRNVAQVARIQRGQQGSRAAAVSAQTPKRENLPVEFKPTSDLEAPPAPPGMVLRWIRFKFGDRPDTQNITKKFRLGWRPFLAKDAPDYLPPETTGTSYGEAICSGDLMLCVQPVDLFTKRNAYYRRQALRHQQATKDKLKGMSDIQVVEDKHTRSGGRRPSFQSDSE